MKNKTIFVACDTSNLNKIKKIITETRTKKIQIVPKFGLQSSSSDVYTTADL